VAVQERVQVTALFVQPNQTEQEISQQFDVEVYSFMSFMDNSCRQNRTFC